MSTVPTEVVTHQFRKQITDDAGDWIAITDLSDRDGNPLAGFERYLFMGVPFRGGRLTRVKINTDADVDFEVLDYPGPVNVQDGPHSIWLTTGIASPGAHYAVGAVGSSLPVHWQLAQSSPLNFSANILTLRLNGAARANVTLLVTVTPD